MPRRAPFSYPVVPAAARTTTTKTGSPPGPPIQLLFPDIFSMDGIFSSTKFQKPKVPRETGLMQISSITKTQQKHHKNATGLFFRSKGASQKTLDRKNGTRL